MRLHMRPYEVMVILDATLEESAVQAVINRTSEAVVAAGGTVIRVDKWGKRRLAYEIGHRSEGYYLLLEITLGSEVVAGLDRSLRLTDEVIRHKIVRVPEHRGTRPSRARPRELVTAGPDHDA
ncbi:MAG: 30S ribosomal protein S6 [Actinobacteria bacterium]|nr:30S ribosomal protein S6 [Actinomycetota bacterium]